MPRRHVNASRRGRAPRRTRSFWSMCKRLGYRSHTPRQVLAWR